MKNKLGFRPNGQLAKPSTPSLISCNSPSCNWRFMKLADDGVAVIETITDEVEDKSADIPDPEIYVAKMKQLLIRQLLK